MSNLNGTDIGFVVASDEDSDENNGIGFVGASGEDDDVIGVVAARDDDHPDAMEAEFEILYGSHRPIQLEFEDFYRRNGPYYHIDSWFGEVSDEGSRDAPGNSPVLASGEDNDAIGVVAARDDDNHDAMEAEFEILYGSHRPIQLEFEDFYRLNGPYYHIDSWFAGVSDVNSRDAPVLTSDEDNSHDATANDDDDLIWVAPASGAREFERLDDYFMPWLPGSLGLLPARHEGDNRGANWTEFSMKGLEIVRVKNDPNSGEEEEECCVCIEKLDVESEAARLPCSHLFHGDCIIKWLNTSNSCPLCRFKLPM